MSLEQGSPHHWQFSMARVRVAFQNPYVYDYITKLCRKRAEMIQKHENENVPNIGQSEIPYRKYMRLKLGGGYLYDRSSVYTALTT
jgi:hypothetical protein